MSVPRALLSNVVDYAGLFPPATLPMSDVVDRYATYRSGAHGWMLGALVVPLGRLGELAQVFAAQVPNGSDASSPWPLSVLVDDVARDARVLRDFTGNAGAFAVEMLEMKTADGDAIDAVMRALGPAGLGDARVFAELPWGADFETIAAVASGAGCGLKLRTGGVTVDAFPAAGVVLRFMAACASHGVPYKLTAGLHHPLRAEHPLTYETGCARGTMYGFLNVLVASALLASGHDARRVAPVLEERSAHAFHFDDGVEIGGMRADADALARGRRLLQSFGSCSFDEPVGDLRALGILPSPHGDAVHSTIEAP
jgi:hypothetical protein